MVVKLLTYYGEEVDIMLIFSPQIPHILSVNLKVSSTQIWVEEPWNFRIPLIQVEILKLN